MVISNQSWSHELTFWAILPPLPTLIYWNKVRTIENHKWVQASVERCSQLPHGFKRCNQLMRTQQKSRIPKVSLLREVSKYHNNIIRISWYVKILWFWSGIFDIGIQQNHFVFGLHRLHVVKTVSVNPTDLQLKTPVTLEDFFDENLPVSCFEST